ncbi:PqiC family protein [Jannaschia seosinensis]|nr:ABC-type transport auxiliary lipoprotein family protein [Jannaschia seosinensis]
MTRSLLLALPLALLAGCGQTLYFAPPPAQSDLRVAVGAESVQINRISIPEYAINQEIPIQQPDGSLSTDTDRLWADLPDRAMLASMVRNLNVITDAQVAAEPWPLSGFPEIELSIFVDDMIVQANGVLRMTGTYAFKSETGRDRIEPFLITAPVAEVTSYTAIIAAHEAAWIKLSEQIARVL